MVGDKGTFTWYFEIKHNESDPLIWTEVFVLTHTVFAVRTLSLFIAKGNAF